MDYIASTFWSYTDDGRPVLRFVNEMTGAERIQTYKTVSAAKAAETKFHNRMGRIYSNTVLYTVHI